MKNPFRREPRDKEFDQELTFHIEKLRQEYVARGMSDEDARRQATLEFGGSEQTKEELRDVHRLPLIETLLSNLRYAARTLRKAPGFSATVIITLALGIGANTSVFSAVDAVLLRPLPYPEADRLVSIEQHERQTHNLPQFIAPARLEDWNELNSTFDGITGWFTEDASETSGPLPEKMTRAFVAPRFLGVWGVSPMLGRDFSAEEWKYGGPNAILISERVWRERFGGKPDVLGKTLWFGNMSSTIVGVMPASFHVPHNADTWSPVPPHSPYSGNRESTWYTVVGRMKRGVGVQRAQTDLDLVQRRLGAQYPATDAKLTVVLKPLKAVTVGDSGTSLWLLFGSVTLLLLIACTNVAALLLARGTERQGEIAVRYALGGSRRSIIAQLIAEAFVLSITGAAAGLALAAAAQRVLRSLAVGLPRADEIVINWRIGVYALVCAIAATLLCGILPSLRATRTSLSETISQKSRTQVSGRHPLQWTLVGIQVSLAVTLLAGAGLLLRSLRELGRVSPGFDPDHVLTLRISGSWGETADMKRLKQRITNDLERIRAVPGVENAATAAVLPGVPGEYPTELKFLDGPSDPTRKISADSRFVSPSYFATMRVPLLAGQGCRDSDENREAIVNQSFATHYFGGESPMGHHMQIASSASSFALQTTVVGIAADAREQGVNRAPMPTVYWCMVNPTPSPYFLVRTKSDPAALVSSLRKAVFEVEPGRSVFDTIPLTEQLTDAFAENRMRTVLLTAFAVTAVSLACIGLYGTLSYLVSVRRREVGLRLALGARRHDIVVRFMAQGVRVAAIGCACGVVLAVASGRLLKSVLFGVSAVDVPTLSSVVVLLLLVAGLAALIPSLRAAHTDPQNVLRES